MKIIIRQLKRSQYEMEPWQAWNLFIDICAVEETWDLSPIQQTAHLAFWYDSELNNGGHLQYFENHGLTKYQDTLDALSILGAQCQRSVLERAYLLAADPDSLHPKTVNEFVKVERDSDYETLDNEFHKCRPIVHDLLEKYLAKHFNEFIQLID